MFGFMSPLGMPLGQCGGDMYWGMPVEPGVIGGVGFPGRGDGC